MKKLNVILLILSFILSGIGSIFLFDANSSTNNTIQTVAPSNKIESEEITEYTYKTYENYFIDYFNLPEESYTRNESTGVVTIDYTKITRSTANGNIELSCNGNVFDSITSDDLTGTGSQTDPYKVHSTKGFLYLSNNSNFGFSLAYKYIQLNCDVILNEESFDENGFPSVGDGVVYNFEPIKNWTYSYFNGNGNAIKGLYINDSSKDNVGLFVCLTNIITNFTMKNVYLNGNKRVSAISAINSTSKEITNVKVYGTIKGKTYIAGISCHSITTIKNCENYANIIQEDYIVNSADRVSGVAHHADLAENLKNYGNISCFYAGYVGGVIGSVQEGTNLENYGEIIIENKENSKLTAVGGVVGLTNGGKLMKLKNCNNYGSVKRFISGFGGAILGYAFSPTEMIQCTNFADCRSACGFVGYQGEPATILNISDCYNYGKLERAVLICNSANKININNCYNYGEIESMDSLRGILFSQINDDVMITNSGIYGIISGQGAASYYNIFGMVYKNGGVTAENFVFDAKIKQESKDFNLFGYSLDSAGQHIIIRNSKFNINFDNSVLNSVKLLYKNSGKLEIVNTSFYFEYKTNLSASLVVVMDSNATLAIKNVIFDEKCSSLSQISDVCYKQYQNIIIPAIYSLVRQLQTNTKTLKQYYGEDFSGYYYSWRTGEIGIVALDGRGQFQGVIDEEWLTNNGYQKKSA